MHRAGERGDPVRADAHAAKHLEGFELGESRVRRGSATGVLEPALYWPSIARAFSPVAASTVSGWRNHTDAFTPPLLSLRSSTGQSGLPERGRRRLRRGPSVSERLATPDLQGHTVSAGAHTLVSAVRKNPTKDGAMVSAALLGALSAPVRPDVLAPG